MERLLELEMEAFERRAAERAQAAIRQIGEAVNAGRTGHVIADSEMTVKRIGEDLIRDLFAMAAQARVDCTESAFSPSAGCRGRTDAKQGPAGPQ